MDTPLHAVAIPNADPSTLRRPEDSAVDIIERMLGFLSSATAIKVGVQP